MQNRPHEGQIVRISDLKVDARVMNSCREKNGDYFGIQEIRSEEDLHLRSSYGYYRKEGSDQWTDCDGQPVTVELIEDAPKPYQVGFEQFFDEMMVAMVEGQGVILPSAAGEFAEAVRNHVATEGCGDQWQKLALARLRGGYPSLYEPEKFIEFITALDAECNKPRERREAFYAQRRGA